MGVLQKFFSSCFVAGLLAISAPAAALLPFEMTGNLYVSMWDSDEIAVFEPDGTAVERFTAAGLDGPRGIAFNPTNGEIWVAGEFSNAIYIFDHNHQFLRTVEHEDFNEPVGVTFAMTASNDASDQLVYIGNSNGNEIMVFDQDGVLQRRFTDATLLDPNCTAFTQDGNLFVANRLGSSSGTSGAISVFNAQDNFQYDFTTAGIASLMAVARDPNAMPTAEDDTIWATSGGGDTGIYEFDQSGNLLKTLLPQNIGDGRSVVPQGIAFDGSGQIYVISFLNEVLKLDTNGNFIARFPTGDGTARSTAFQGCQNIQDGRCIPLGVDAGNVANPDTETGTNTGGGENTATTDINGAASDSGGGVITAFTIVLILLCRRRLERTMRAL